MALKQSQVKFQMSQNVISHGVSLESKSSGIWHILQTLYNVLLIMMLMPSLCSYHVLIMSLPIPHHLKPRVPDVFISEWLIPTSKSSEQLYYWLTDPPYFSPLKDRLKRRTAHSVLICNEFWSSLSLPELLLKPPLPQLPRQTTKVSGEECCSPYPLSPTVKI